MSDICPYCGSGNSEYMGVTDAGGYYGGEEVDDWNCLDCGGSWETEIESGLPSIRIEIDR